MSMTNIDGIKFVVDTKQLDEAVTKVQDLGQAVKTTANDMKSSVESTKKLSVSTLDLADAQIKALRTQEAAARVRTAEAKTLEQEAKALVAIQNEYDTAERAASKLAKSQETNAANTEEVEQALTAAEKALQKQTIAMQILRGETVQVGEEYVKFTDGLSKSQANQLANMKLQGATAEQMKLMTVSYEEYNRITGINTFDKSASALEKMRKEMAELTAVNKVAGMGFALTQDQVVGLVREGERLVQQLQSEHQTTITLDQAISQLAPEYVKTAAAVNLLRAESEKMTNQARLEASQKIRDAKAVETANEYLEKEMTRVNAALEASKEKISVGMSNQMQRFAAALKASGIEAGQAKVMLEKYKEVLVQLQGASGQRAADHLSRALGPQITDIVVGLSTGQSLMTVLLQQGGQVRDQIAQFGVEAGKTGEVLRKAASEMVSSIFNTGIGIFQGLGSAAKDAGLAIGRFIGDGIKSFGNFIVSIGKTKAEMEALQATAGSTGNFFGKLANWLSTSSVAAVGFGVAALGIIAILGTLAYGMYQSIKAQDELAKAFAFNGGMMSMSSNEAMNYAKRLIDMGASVSEATELLSEMTKTGKFTENQIADIGRVAIELKNKADIPIKDTVARFAEFKDKPVEALIELAKQTGRVSDATIESVNNFIRQGDVVKAQQLAMSEYGRVSAESIEDMKTRYNAFAMFFIEASHKIKDAAKSVWSWMFEKDPAVSKWQDDLDTVERRLKTLKGRMIPLPGDDTAIARLETQQRILQSRIAAENQLAAEQNHQRQLAAELSQDEQKRLALQNAGLDYLHKETKEKQTLAQYTEDYIKLKAREQGYDITKLYNDQKTLGILKEAAKVEWEKAQKKSQFASPELNSISEVEKQSKAQLDTLKKNYEDQSKEYKQMLDTNQISMAQYLDDQLALVNSNYSARIALQKDMSSKLTTAETQDIVALEKYRSGLTEEKDIKRVNEQIAALRKKYEDERAVIKAAIEGIEADKSKAEKSTFDVLYKLSKDLKTLADEQSAKFAENALKRQEELDLMNQTLTTSGLQLDYEKARTASLKESAKQIALAQQKLEQIKQVMDNTTDLEVWMNSSKQYAEQKIAVDKMIADARVESEKAGNHAIVEDYYNEMILIQQGLTDAVVTALFEGGKAGRKKLRDLIVAELKKPVTIVVNAVIKDITGNFFSQLISLVGGSGGSLSKLLGGSGSGSSLFSMVSSANSLYDFMTKGFEAIGTSTMLSIGKGLTYIGDQAGWAGMSEFGSGMQAQAAGYGQEAAYYSGSSATSAGASTSSIGASTTAIAAGIYGGVKGGHMVSGGYSAWGGQSGSSAVNTGTAIGTAIGAFFGPAGAALGAFLGGLAGGAVNRMFGKKLKATGIEGDFSGTGFSGRNYEFYKGGWFSSDKTKYSNIDPDTQKTLTSNFANLKAGMQGIANYFGETGKAGDVAAYSKYVKWNFKGKSSDQIEAMVTDTFKQMQEEMSKLILSGTDFAKKGETATDTLNRLKTSLESVNAVLWTFDDNLLSLSLKSADLASSLIDLFGGMDKFKSAMSDYYSKFYSEDERMNKTMKQLTLSFVSLGVKIPKTIKEFRDLVNAQDLTTDSGQLTFNALIGLSDAFYQVMQYTDKTAAAADTAAQKMKDFTKTILDYVDGLSSATGDTNASYQYARAVFGEQVGLVKKGDTGAMDNITSYADKLLSAAKENASSSVEYDKILGQVKAELLGLTTGTYASTTLTGAGASSLTSSVTTATQVVEQTVTTQELLTKILSKLEEMNQADRSEAEPIVSKITDIAKVIKRAENTNSINVTVVT